MTTEIPKQKLRITNNRYSLFGIIVLWLMILSSLLNTMNVNIPGLSSTDEMITLVFICYIVVHRKKLEKSDKYKLLCLLGIVLIGLASNYTSGIDRKFEYIVLDIILFSKTFITYIGMKVVCKNDKIRYRIINSIAGFMKIFLILCFIFGTINLFTDIGMSKNIRYGFRSFSFIFNQPAHCGLFCGIAVALIILSNKHKTRNKEDFYIFIGLMCILYTTKGMAFVIGAVFVALELFTKYRNKIKWYHLVLIAIICVPVLSFQIQNYIFNSKNVRARFLNAGFEIAKTYFPLGSGFATFGSEMAARYYSPLYVKIGFDNLKAFSPESGIYLNDNYLASVLGQFGFFGVALHLLEMYIIFREILSVKSRKKEKNIVLALFISLMAIFVGSGAFKSIYGIEMFMVIALYTSSENKNLKYRRIHCG